MQALALNGRLAEATAMFVQINHRAYPLGLFSEEYDPEDPDEYRAKNIFWVPPEARWSHLKAQAKQPHDRPAR